MKFILIHLTDLHITEHCDLNSRIGSICKLIVHDFKSITKIFLVVSGDITNSGKEVEFLNAQKCLGVIKSLVERELNHIKVSVIIVPGNHDCNFSNDSQIRKISIENANYRTLGNDNSVIETALSVQKEFWSFYSKLNKLPENKIYYQIHDEIEGVKICFHCFNTAWMSQVNEKPGSLFFPVKKIETALDDNLYDINISVYHHPLNWFNPNTEDNNKIEFQSFLDRISTFQIIGHEHQPIFERRENYDDKTSAYYFSGSIFNNNKPDFKSSFQIIEFDVQAKECILKRYIWSQDLFSEETSKLFKIDGEKNRRFIINQTFNDLIEEIKIPISINKITSKLSDLYVFPDIEMIEFDQSHFEDYIDSETLINNINITKCIIEGDGQSGKSSLIHMLFKKYYASNLYPLIIYGHYIDKPDLEKILKQSFINIYSDSDIDFDRYKQLEKSKKVLLIDDFHLFKINAKLAFDMIKDASKLFNQIILTVDTAYSLIPQLQADFEDFDFFALKPLGYKKRNDLIRQYHLIKENPLLLNDEVLLQKTKETFDQVRQILGDRIMPSYPIFILSILQALDYKPLSLNETSYGYCYQTLLHYALVTGANLPNDEIDTYINYLKELAFHFQELEIEEIDLASFAKFHKIYESNYIIPEFEKVRKLLLKSKILKADDGTYSFGYKYILYFLIAKYLSEIINTDKGQKTVKLLFANMHIERNANILVFITHHTKDVTFIEESLFSTMIPFEDSPGITLEKGDPYYQLIQDIAKDLTNDIIEINKKPEEERDKYLKAQDQIQRESEHDSLEIIDNTSEEFKQTIMPFYNSFRSIEIVGQIIKNRKGSLSKQKISELITELYFLSFRTIGFLGGMFKDLKSDLIITLMDRIKDGDTRNKVEQKINHFFQLLSLQACLGVITKLVYSIGVKELRAQYKEVSENIGSPAAKLVSFSINSYYNEVSANEIKTLAKELENNHVAYQILRYKVKSYIYNNYVDYKKKQKIAEALNMKLTSSPKRTQS